MEFQKSNDDCYFYFYSSCTKGSDCPYRHCEQALGSEKVCILWKQGQCFRGDCKFRHMENRMKRSHIPCYWEDQPGGCRKPHCVFYHRRAKFAADDGEQQLILPISSPLATPPQPPAKTKEVPEKSPGTPTYCETADDAEVHSPVPPLVVSFDDGEESDTESVSNTPVKAQKNGVRPASGGTSNSAGTPQKDLGIKTLEQIRMERIHKESEHFYKPAYDTSGVDISLKKRIVEVEPLIKECYPPDSEFISLHSKSNADNKISTPKDETLQMESDLRGKRFKKRSLPLDQDPIPAKRAIKFKKQNIEENSSLGFNIKTLDQIRKEKLSKPANLEENSTSNNSKAGETEVFMNDEQPKPSKIKISRRSKDSSPGINLEIKDSSEEKGLGDKSESVLHDVQNSSDVSIKIENSVFISNGKRKATDNVIGNKRKKINFEESEPKEISPNQTAKQRAKGLSSFLRRRPNASANKSTSQESANPEATLLKETVKDSFAASEPSQEPPPAIHSSMLKVESTDTSKSAEKISAPESEVVNANTTKSEVNTSRLDAAKVDVSRSDVAKVDVSRSDVAKADVSKSDVAKVNVSRLNVAKANATSNSEVSKVSSSDLMSDDVHVAADQSVEDVKRSADHSSSTELSLATGQSDLDESFSSKAAGVERQASSVDDFDSFMEDDSDEVNLDEETTAGDDILLEIEQYLDS